jgi:hypothetical protein
MINTLKKISNNNFNSLLFLKKIWILVLILFLLNKLEIIVVNLYIVLEISIFLQIKCSKI